MTAALTDLRERYDAILLDLDGTLLDGRGALTDRTREAVARVADAGLLVVLCTGRSLLGTRAVHEALGLDTPIVAFNGAWIGRPGEAPWRHAPIPDDLVAEIERTEEISHFFFRHQVDRKYAVARSHALFERVAHWYRDVIHLPDGAGLPAEEVMRVSCYFDGEEHHEAGWQALSEAARARLHRESFPLRIFPEFGDSDLVLCEVQARSRGKAEAYGWLEAEHGIPRARTIAVGDQRNDLSMFREAGLAVGVANAVPEILALAHVVVGHHAEDGVAAWIEAGAPRPAAPARRTGEAGRRAGAGA